MSEENKQCPLVKADIVEKDTGLSLKFTLVGRDYETCVQPEAKTGQHDISLTGNPDVEEPAYSPEL